jgi:chorismate mutase
MTCRGIRGAVCVEVNAAQDIVAATRQLLERIVEANGVDAQDVACVIFSTTDDLDADVPARAAREMGWMHTPLLCLREMMAQGGMERVVRVLMLWNTEARLEEVRHIYLGEARRLRPELAAEEE